MAKTRRRAYPAKPCTSTAFGKRPQSRHHYPNSKEAGCKPEREYRPKR